MIDPTDPDWFFNLLVETLVNMSAGKWMLEAKAEDAEITRRLEEAKVVM